MKSLAVFVHHDRMMPVLCCLGDRIIFVHSLVLFFPSERTAVERFHQDVLKKGPRLLQGEQSVQQTTAA